MLNTRSEECNTILYSYLACFKTTLILNMYVFLSSFNQAEYGIRILVAASQDYVNTYSTCRLLDS